MTPAERVEKAKADGQALIEAMMFIGINPSEYAQRRSVAMVMEIAFEYIDAKFDELEHGLNAVSDVMKVPEDD